MAYTSPASNIIYSLTDAGRQLCARSVIEGISFVFDSWQLGQDGYNMSNPVQVLPISTSDTDLISPIYPTPTTRKPFSDSDFEYPTNRSVSKALRINREDTAANYAIGEIGIWVKIINSPLNPLENDTYVLFAISHTPIKTITFNSALIIRLITSF